MIDYLFFFFYIFILEHISVAFFRHQIFWRWAKLSLALKFRIDCQ